MSEQSIGTSSAYPVDRANHVVAPEYFQPTTLESLAPDQVAYVASNAIAIDSDTGDMYVSTRGYLVGDSDLRPSANETKFRIGMLRCESLLPPDLHVQSVYVADLRYLKANNVSRVDISQPENHFNPEYQRRENNKHSWERLVAAMFTDPDGVPQYLGDERYHDQVEYIILQTEARRQGSEPEADPDRAVVQDPYVPRHSLPDANGTK